MKKIQPPKNSLKPVFAPAIITKIPNPSTDGAKGKVVRAKPGSNTDKANLAFMVFKNKQEASVAHALADLVRVGTQVSHGTIYVYEDTRMASKRGEQKPPNRIYIGSLDGDGNFVPSKRFLLELEAKSRPKLTQKQTGREILGYGGSYLLEEIAKQIGLVDDLKACFPEDYNLILSLAIFLASTNNASMSEAYTWTHRFYHPVDEVIRDQRISELYPRIDPVMVKAYQKQRRTRLKARLVAFYDGSTVSSYSQNIKGVEFGISKDNPDLPQICIGLLIDQDTGEPLIHKILPGNIVDVVTITNLLIELNILAAYDIELVMDRGFYSKENINSMYEQNYKFVLGGKTSVGYINDYVEEAVKTIKGNSNYHPISDIFSLTYIHKWPIENNGQKSTKNLFVHVYYEMEKHRIDLRLFMTKLDTAIDSWQKNVKMTDEQNKLIEKFCVIKEKKDGSLELHKNGQKIDEYTKDMGIFVLVSNSEKDAQKALEKYRDKDKVEKCFDNLKNRFDLDTTKVQSNENLEGKMFLQVIALTLAARINKVLKDNKMIKSYSAFKLIDRLNLIKRKSFPDHETFFDEITKKQVEIYEMFGVPPPNVKWSGAS